jgi:hypothetical protein
MAGDARTSCYWTTGDGPNSSGPGPRQGRETRMAPWDCEQIAGVLGSLGMAGAADEPFDIAALATEPRRRC